MTFAHAVVWIDHQRAEVVHLSNADEQTVLIPSPGPPRKLHRKSGVPGSGRAPVNTAFFDEVGRALTDVRKVLVVGPGLAKVEFAAHLARHHPDEARKMAGLEALDHPTHADLVAHARRFFARVEHLDGVDLR